VKLLASYLIGGYFPAFSARMIFAGEQVLEGSLNGLGFLQILNLVMNFRSC